MLLTVTAKNAHRAPAGLFGSCSVGGGGYSSKIPDSAIFLANALDATADDLLADHLTGSNTTLKEEVIDLLHDSTPAEKAILMDMLRHMKQLLQEHGI